MAFIGIKIPEVAIKELSLIDAPGERSKPEDMHITLLYLGKQASLDQIIKSFAVLASIAQRTKPFMVGCAMRTCFPENPDDGFPVIARVQSPSIAKFRNTLIRAMDAMNVEYSNKWPDFKPHVTLSYAEEMCENLSFKPIMWKVNAITVWGGEDMNDRIVASAELQG